mmetsp:Transcript_50536/g.94385  ORF Transcript_50536/g.94385 Transcript_50536/m.94385 type:complete len:96 (-) Transcript_50536:147-434(-)
MLQPNLQNQTIQVMRIVMWKGQCLEAIWKPHTKQALIEEFSKRQCLEAIWQYHIILALIEIRSKRQCLGAIWQCHTIQAVIEPFSKGGQHLPSFL